MQHSKGTRLVAAAALTLGLTFSMSACSATDLADNAGKSPIAAQNKDAGITIREDQVQEALGGARKLVTAQGQNADSITSNDMMQMLAVEPLLADAAQGLGAGVSMDDARKDLDSTLAAVKQNRPGVDAPEPTDSLVHLIRYGLLQNKLQQVEIKDKKVLEATKQKFNKNLKTGWTFGPRYGGFAMTEDGSPAVTGARPWLGKYVPYVDPNQLHIQPGGPVNGRPIEEARSPEGDTAPQQGTAPQGGTAPQQGTAPQEGTAPQQSPAATAKP